jgi:hypothetical protein
MRRPIHVYSAVFLSVLIAVTAGLVAGPQPAAAAEGDKRPNLQMLSLRDWHIQNVNGRRLLRFGSIFVNSGPGAFEVHGRRDSSSDGTMDIRQRMFRWDGTSRFIKTAAVAKYAADGHDHWHVQGVATYETWKLNNPGDTARRGGKTGFCFLDSEPWDLSVPYAPQSPVYHEHRCGTRGSISNSAGLSVGWADNYPWFFAFQWIDITGLPGGTYQVRVTVDIQNFYDERVERDNCVWTRIRIPAPGSSSAPTVEANGSDCGANAIKPVTSFQGGTTWDPPRRARIEPGPHSGYKFNSVGTVLRTKRVTVQSERNVKVSARGTPPGSNDRYFYMTSGPFEGYWVKRGGGVGLVP